MSSVKCDCVEAGGYCTFCDMANDMLDYLASEEDNSVSKESSNVESDSVGPVVDPVGLRELEEEA